MLKRYFFAIILVCSHNSFAQTEWKINKSDNNEMIIEFSTNNVENYNYMFTLTSKIVTIENKF